MITKELVDFIKNQKSIGKNNEETKILLIQNGWLATDVDEAVLSLMPSPYMPPVSNVPYISPSTLNNYAPREIPVLSPAEFIKPTTGAVKVMPKKSHTGLILSIIFVLLLIATGASAYVFRDNLKTLPLIKKFFPAVEVVGVVEVVGEVPAVPPPVVVPAEVPVVPIVQPVAANCDGNMDCLIAAAAKCEPISGVVSYSNLPFPFFKGLDMSGTTKYEIKSSQDPKSCTLVYSVLSSSFSVSDINRKKILAEEKGSTNADIDAQLKTMNDGSLETINIPTTCVSNSSALSSYLVDLKKQTSGQPVDLKFSTSFKMSSNVSETTITTSSGQKLICTMLSQTQ